MIKRKLYAVAIIALKPDPDHENITTPGGGICTRFTGDGVHNTHVEFLPGVEHAQSLDEAMGNALTVCKEKWPESDGYILHRAYATEIDDLMILEAAISIHAEMQPQANELEREM